MNTALAKARAKTAIKINPIITEDQQALIDSGDLLMSDGVKIPLSASDKKKVVYSKFESQNPNISDTQHDEFWMEQFTSSTRVLMLGDEDREQFGISEDDGIIMTFHGEPASEVCIDLSSNRVIDMMTAALEEEATGNSYPRYVKWDFFLFEAILTNGPEERAELHEVAEKQRAKAEAASSNKMSSVLDKLLTRLEGVEDGNTSITDSSDPLAALLATMSPTQIKAEAEMRVADIEHEQHLKDVAVTEATKAKEKKGK